MLDNITKIFSNTSKWQNPRWMKVLVKTTSFSNKLKTDRNEILACRWTKLSTSGTLPPERSGHSSVIIGNLMYIFGGYNSGNCHNDLYVFDLLSHNWKKIDPPSHIDNFQTDIVIPDGRASHSWCAASNQSKIYLFGGSGPQWGQTNMGKLLEYHIDINKWIISAVGEGSQHPPPGYGQTLCAIKNKIYLFGGTSGHIYVNDLYMYDEISKVWSFVHTIGAIPSPRYKHQVITYKDNIYILGGGLYDPPEGPLDVHILNINTLTWSYITCTGMVPSSRIAHTAIQHSKEDWRVLLFGGRDAQGHRTNDIHELNLNDFVWKKYEIEQDDHRNKKQQDMNHLPDKIDFHTAGMFDGQMFIFGGSNGTKRNNEIYRFRTTFSPSTLVVITMQTIQNNKEYYYNTKEYQALPIELKNGLENINPHVNICSPTSLNKSNIFFSDTKADPGYINDSYNNKNDEIYRL